MTRKLGGVANARRTASTGVGLALLCILAWTAPAHAQYRYERATATFAGAHYVVQPGDQLRVRIWGWPDPADHTEGSFPVEQTGIVFLPVIGQLHVAGRTAQEIQDEYRKRFAEEQRNPVVTVEPVFAVSVMGEVKFPGVVDVEPGYTIFDAITTAGGYTDNAKRTSVLVVRKSGSVEVGGSNPDEAAAKLATMPLESGDRIVVPRAGTPHLQTLAVFLQAFVSAATFVVLLTRN